MNFQTPLHADHQLDQLAAQFEHWRQHRFQPRQRIPKTLWEQAVALCDHLPYTRVAKHLRLGNKDLKARINAQVDSTPKTLSTPLGFVEVPCAPEHPQAPSMTEIELQRKDGARLRLHAPDTSVSAIVRSFLEAQ
jgi:hypothetical protein